ncbi:MAG: phage baseplate protein [bacterium]
MSGFDVNLLKSAPILGAFIGNGFRPPQWSQPQLTSITALEPSVLTQAVSHNISFGDSPLPSGAPAPTTKQIPGAPVATTYFFDAILRVDHEQELRSTDHPVQVGASLSDHAYLLPARVVLEIGMSDVLDVFQAGQFTSNASKSISAYEKLLELQKLRSPLTVTTRLRVYQNMVIASIRSEDTVSTLHGLRAVVEFREIIVGTVSTVTQSARPHATQTTNPGAAQPQAVTPAIKQKYLNPSGQYNSNVPFGGGRGTAF